MTKHMWSEILGMDSISKRLKKYQFYFINEMRKAKHKQKKAENQAKKDVDTNNDSNVIDTNRPEPRAMKTIFFTIRESTMKTHYYHNLAHAMVHGHPMVIDLSFEDSMTQRELMSLSTQIRDSFALNKERRDPLHMVLCSLRNNGNLYKLLCKHMVDFDNLPFTITDKSYCDFFSKNDIVYLSPNSNHVMKDFNHGKIYVIGGIVDLAEERPKTLARAKKERIASVKLPLDKYIE